MRQYLALTQCTEKESSFHNVNTQDDNHHLENTAVTIINNRCNYLYIQSEKFEGSQAVATL
jgi:hypothetical protein